MRIDPTSSLMYADPRNAHAKHAVASRQVRPTQFAQTLPQPSAETPVDPPVEAPVDPPVEPPTDLPPEQPVEEPVVGRRRGVIGLLQEGHFKGVAGLRLRINFFDELAAAGTELPPIAEPPVGSSKAYQKFLAIYQEMASVPDSEDETPEEPPIAPENPLAPEESTVEESA